MSIVYCCGDNNKNMLGFSESLMYGPTVTEPTPLELPGNVRGIFGGINHTIFWLASGDVYVAGDNEKGQCTVSKDVDTCRGLVRSPLLSALDISMISVGRDHNAFLCKNSNRVFTSGSNEAGACGSGPSDFHFSPYLIPSSCFDDEVVKYVACGGIIFTFFVTEATDGSCDHLYFCGQSTFGVNGSNGQFAYSDVPRRIQSSVLNNCRIESISCGSYHAILKTSKGEFYGAGYQGNGELGLGNTQSQKGWTKLSVQNLTRVICGYYHTLFHTSTNDILISGSNSGGGLSLGLSAPSANDAVVLNPISVLKHIPANEIQDDPIVDTFCAGYHRAYITQSGKYIMTGHSKDGQLGTSTSNSLNVVPCLFPFRNRFVDKVKFAGGTKTSFFYLERPKGSSITRYMSTLHHTIARGAFTDLDIFL